MLGEIIDTEQDYAGLPQNSFFIVDFNLAVYSLTGKVLWVFVPGKLLAGLNNPFKLSVVNLYGDDIFIMFKASTQQGADWSISWAFV